MKFILIAILAVALVSGSAVEERTKLLNELMKDYNDNVEPDNKDVKFGICLMCSMYNYEDGIMETIVVEKYSWTDSRLSWNPTEHGGVQTIRISIDEIWTPNIKIYNGLEHIHPTSSHFDKVIVDHTGKVVRADHNEYSTLCLYDTSSSEFLCKYIFGSFSEDNSVVKLHSLEESSILMIYQNSTCPLLPTVKSKIVGSLSFPLYPTPFDTLDLTVTYKVNEEVVSKMPPPPHRP